MKNYGTIAIDELKICYVAHQDSMLVLENVEVGDYLDYLNYRFYRLTNERFRYYYDVFDAEGEVAQLKFGHYTDADDAEHYVFLRVLNPILYQAERMHRLLALPDAMGLYFNNYTAIDLAFDTNTNVTTLIKKMMRDEEVTTIFNGKAVKDRKGILQGVTFEYSTTLQRLHYPTITFKQRKAIAKKDEGVTVQAYDKKAEIENRSDKQYILEYYGNPKRLYRLEVRLRYRELKEFFASRHIVPKAGVLLNADLLKEMFIYHLSAVIRFRRGRKRIRWTELLGMSCQGVE